MWVLKEERVRSVSLISAVLGTKGFVIVQDLENHKKNRSVQACVVFSNLSQVTSFMLWIAM